MPFQKLPAGAICCFKWRIFLTTVHCCSPAPAPPAPPVPPVPLAPPAPLLLLLLQSGSKWLELNCKLEELQASLVDFQVSDLRSCRITGGAGS